MSRPVRAWSLLLRETQASSLGWYGSPCQGSETTGTQPFCLRAPPRGRGQSLSHSVGLLGEAHKVKKKD